MLRLDLNIDSMRLAIVQALQSRELELEQLVTAEVQRLKADLPAIIREHVRQAQPAWISTCDRARVIAVYIQRR